MNIGEIETIYAASKNMTESVYVSKLVNDRVEAILSIKEISRITGLSPFEDTDPGGTYGWCGVRGDNFEVLVSYDL